MSRKAPSLTDFRRIVVKVGSSLLVDSDGGRLHDDWLSALAEDIAGLHRDKRDVLVVSSGAIALGRRARDRLTDAGLAVEYMETDAAHWVPPQVLPPAIELVAAVTAEAAEPA